MTGLLAFARARRLLLVVGLAFAALPVGSALAGTTIGEAGGGTNDCGIQGVLADTNYVVPAGGGTITSFSYFKSGPYDQPADFVVLRPAGGSNYTVIGQTGVVVTPAGTGLQTYPANIAVQGGDILGVWSGPQGLSVCVRFVGSGGGVITSGSETVPSDPVLGQTVFFKFTLGMYDLNESATFVPALPTSTAQCKNGGWKTYGVFKNQGDCVAFVASGGKNPPSGA